MTTPRFSVVTGSVIESGTTIAYLIESVGLRVEKIYFDTMQTFSRKKASPAPPKPRWFSRSRLQTSHRPRSAKSSHRC